jgi:hypothetical protein
MNEQFLAIARDPQIIPGVHHHCDEWCHYCGVTQRCLAFRCTEAYRKAHGRLQTQATFTGIDEAAAFTRDVSAIEGRRTDELDALMTHPPGQSGVQTSDPLADLAFNYAALITALMFPVLLEFANAPAAAPGPGGPTAVETIGWYHVRIYMKVFRALVAREAQNDANAEEALGSAKAALVSIDRSLDAIGRSDDLFDDADRRRLHAMLTRLQNGMEAAFPAARGFVRIGLDQPVGRP